MTEFRTDTITTLNAVLFILEKLGGKADFHQLFKLLYFADRKHVALYGRPITGELYVAMKDGPVPSDLYDFVKFMGGRGRYIPKPWVQELLTQFHLEEPYYIVAHNPPNLDYIPESAIDILSESIAIHSGKDFSTRRDDSHDSAWEKAYFDMSYLDMAEVEGASEEIKAYITDNIENQQVFNHAGLPRR